MCRNCETEKSAASDACFPSCTQPELGQNQSRKLMQSKRDYNLRIAGFTFPSIPMPQSAAWIMLTSFPPSPAAQTKLPVVNQEGCHLVATWRNYQLYCLEAA